MSTLSTTWEGDGELPVSRPPSRRTSKPFCAVAINRSTGRVIAEITSMPPLPSNDDHPVLHAGTSWHITGGAPAALVTGTDPLDQPSLCGRGAAGVWLPSRVCTV